MEEKQIHTKNQGLEISQILHNFNALDLNNN